MIKTKGYGITLGSGNSIHGEGVYRGVSLQLQSINIDDDFLPLSLRSSDVIIGIQWQEKLVMTYTNWKLQIMKFPMGNQPITLRGGPSLGKSRVSLKARLRTIKHKGSGVLVELNHLETMKTDEENEPDFLRSVLQKFDVVFNMPQWITSTLRKQALDNSYGRQ